MTTVQLVSLEAVRPSTYNPRITDPARLELVKLSLRKLGFVLPVYADQHGEILSGHQRHLAASELGWEQVPVTYTKPYALNDRRNINVMFNRGTNDLRVTDTSESITEQLDLATLTAQGEALPDKAGDERFPCLSAVPCPVRDFIEANAGSWNHYARNLARVLAVKGIRMPIVARRDRVVVNGIGRIQFAAETDPDGTVEVVFVSETEAAFAEAMLNYLSMDFNLHERYADVLRHNSFRRGRKLRAGKTLGPGMLIALGLSNKGAAFDIHIDDNFAIYRRRLGDRILDFGAGRLEDVVLLRSKGIDADAFEPFMLTPGTDQINPDLARTQTREFLAAVAAGKQWTSIFLQAVLNSVPFPEDRRHVVCLLAALAGPATTVYAHASSRKAGGYQNVAGATRYNKSDHARIAFKLAYEPGVMIGEYQSMPKVQKHFTQAEFTQLFQREFRTVVRQGITGGSVYGAFRHPRGVHRERLREAIAFEFDLLYPDGSRLGLVEQALAAFEQRLGVTL